VVDSAQRLRPPMTGGEVRFTVGVVVANHCPILAGLRRLTLVIRAWGACARFCHDLGQLDCAEPFVVGML